MKIAQVMLAKGFGGAERHFVDLARGLAQRGDTVLAICHRRFSARAELAGIEGLETVSVPVYGPWDRIAAWRIRRELARFRPLAVQVHLARAAGLGAPAARGLGIPVVANTHNFIKLEYYREVDHFITPTSRLIDYLTGAGIGSDRITHIPHFTAMPDRAPLMHARNGSLRLAALGRLVRKKGYDVLLHALATATAAGADINLTLAGDGPERGALEALVRSLGLTARVEFRGWITDPAALLTNADAFVLPSLLEPFGIVVLEAMAAGLPVISTRSDGPLEILDETCAWFAEVGDRASLAAALRACADDESARQTKAAAAWARFSTHYSDEVMLPRYRELYATLAEARVTAAG